MYTPTQAPQRYIFKYTVGESRKLLASAALMGVVRHPVKEDAHGVSFAAEDARALMAADRSAVAAAAAAASASPQPLERKYAVMVRMVAGNEVLMCGRVMINGTDVADCDAYVKTMDMIQPWYGVVHADAVIDSAYDSKGVRTWSDSRNRDAWKFTACVELITW